LNAADCRLQCFIDAGQSFIEPGTILHHTVVAISLVEQLPRGNAAIATHDVNSEHQLDRLVEESRR
jgi:hypothetical protein